MVTDAACPTTQCSRPAPIASLWLATALMKTKERGYETSLVPNVSVESSSIVPHLVVTMVPKLWIDFLSPSVSIIRSSWSFSSGWYDRLRPANSPNWCISSWSTWRLATHASPAKASSDWVQEDLMSSSLRTRLSSCAWRTWIHSQHGSMSAMKYYFQLGMSQFPYCSWLSV